MKQEHLGRYHGTELIGFPSRDGLHIFDKTHRIFIGCDKSFRIGKLNECQSPEKYYDDDSDFCRSRRILCRKLPEFQIPNVDVVIAKTRMQRLHDSSDKEKKKIRPVEAPYTWR